MLPFMSTEIAHNGCHMVTSNKLQVLQVMNENQEEGTERVRMNMEMEVDFNLKLS